MKIKQIEVFEFSELDKEVQKKVINHFRNDGYFDNPQYLKEVMTEKLKEELEKAKMVEVEKPELHYSLSYCQGDGAMFTGKFEWNGWTVKIEHRGHYYHERSTNIDMTKDTEEGEVYASVDELEHFEEKVYIPICLELKKVGYSVVDEEYSEEYITDLIEVNDYTFRKDGTIEHL